MELTGNEGRYWLLMQEYGRLKYPGLNPTVLQVEGSPGFYQMHFPGVGLPIDRSGVTEVLASWALDHLDAAMEAPEPFDAKAFVAGQVGEMFT